MQFKNLAIGAINSRTKSKNTLQYKKNLIISCFVPSSVNQPIMYLIAKCVSQMTKLKAISLMAIAQTS